MSFFLQLKHSIRNWNPFSDALPIINCANKTLYINCVSNNAMWNCQKSTFVHHVITISLSLWCNNFVSIHIIEIIVKIVSVCMWTIYLGSVKFWNKCTAIQLVFTFWMPLIQCSIIVDRFYFCFQQVTSNFNAIKFNSFRARFTLFDNFGQIIKSQISLSAMG